MTKVMNIESKVEYRGATPVCVHCHKLFSLKKMNEVETAKAHETGLCSKCQSEVVTTVTTPEVKKVETVAEVKKEKKASAGSTIRMIFYNAIKEGKVTDNILNVLTNAEATKVETGIKFAFLKKFDQFATMKEQVMIKNKARYSTKMVEINGENYLVTNNLFERNINPFKAMFEVE